VEEGNQSVSTTAKSGNLSLGENYAVSDVAPGIEKSIIVSIPHLARGML
jgi:hypothetical protein